MIEQILARELNRYLVLLELDNSNLAIFLFRVSIVSSKKSSSMCLFGVENWIYVM